MSKKYELTKQTKSRPDGAKVYRIKALRNIEKFNVKKGDLGGWVESESNLSQEGDCWIADDAIVSDNATVKDNAYVYNEAIVRGKSIIKGKARVYGNATIYGFTVIYGKARIYDKAFVSGSIDIAGNARVHGNAKVYGFTVIKGKENIAGEAYINDNTDYLYINMIRDKLELDITFFKYKNNTIMCNYNNAIHSLDEFKKDIKSKLINYKFHQLVKMKKEIALLCKLVDNYFK